MDEMNHLISLVRPVRGGRACFRNSLAVVTHLQVGAPLFILQLGYPLLNLSQGEYAQERQVFVAIRNPLQDPWIRLLPDQLRN